MAKKERPTEPFRAEHEHLMHHLTDLRRTLDGMRGGLSPTGMEGLKEAEWFLRAALKPHAVWEEGNLYPLVNEIIRQYGKPSATMEVDHEDLVARIDTFTQELQGLQAGRTTAEDLDRIRVLGYQIDAILSLHFRKEEDVYLDAIDEHARKEEVEELIKAAQQAHVH